MPANFKLFVFAIGVILLNFFWSTEAQIDVSRLGVSKVLGEKQYFVQKVTKVNFHKALQYCATLNMTLASIESATEQQNLKSFLSGNSLLSSHQYWLSGTDLALSREFVWFGAGTLFSYTSWAPGVRINLNQRCVRTDGNFNWRREFCTNSQYFICEKPVVPACGANGTCLKKDLIVF